VVNVFATLSGRTRRSPRSHRRLRLEPLKRRVLLDVSLPGRLFDVPEGVFAVTTADFDLDGHADLALTNTDADSVSVLLGNGDGTFQAPQAFASDGASASTLTSADFNEDGNPDLATANNRTTVSVLLGNGDGTFQDHVEYEAGRYTASIANGDGTFGVQQEYSVGSFPRGAAAADLDQDGDLDLVG
jgi:hypothetical protein